MPSEHKIEELHKDLEICKKGAAFQEKQIETPHTYLHKILNHINKTREPREPSSLKHFNSSSFMQLTITPTIKDKRNIASILISITSSTQDVPSTKQQPTMKISTILNKEFGDKQDNIDFYKSFGKIA